MGAMIQMHYIYCAVLFLLLWHQLHLRSSGIRSLEEFSSLHWSWCAAGQGMKKRVGHDWVTKLNWTEPSQRHWPKRQSRSRCFSGIPLLFLWSNRCWQFHLWLFCLFSKSNHLCIWKFLVHVLLKPSLKNFEHDFASTWNECNCVVVLNIRHCLSLGLEWKLTFSFSSPVTTAKFSKFVVQHFHIIIF